jgi:alkaline phosphatase
MRTGVVTTTRVTDATPAAFCSHSSDRKYEDYIATQVIDIVGFQKHMDVILGGGLAHFNSMREDATSILPQAVEKGYTVVSNSAQLANITGGKVLGLFADYNMAYSIDRQNNATINATQPSLMDMTRKALELLDNEDGFFVMLEGALIDVAEHANDAGAAIREILDYNDAFSIALEYAKQHGNTIIISTSDHETGGLTLGLQTNFSPGAYPDYAYYPQKFAAFNASCDTMARRIMYNGEDVKTVIASSTGITDITDKEAADIQQYTIFAEMSGAIGKTVTARALVGWTTHGHSGVDVNLYIYGLPADHSYFGANVENIDVSTLIAQLLGLDISAMTKEVMSFPTNESDILETEKVRTHTRDHYHDHL